MVSASASLSVGFPYIEVITKAQLDFKYSVPIKYDTTLNWADKKIQFSVDPPKSVNLLYYDNTKEKYLLGTFGFFELLVII